jgi:hypothetical protein
MGNCDTPPPEQRLGDGPLEERYRLQMIEIAKILDQYFNPQLTLAPAEPRKTGFVLLVFPFNAHEGRCNYISNGADRGDIVTLFREQIARFEGMPAGKGSG